MKKELKAQFANMKTTLCFQLAGFTQRQSRKAFVLSSLICMSATAMAALSAAENPYQASPRSLIASGQQSNSNSSQEINSLREQLLEKTKELQEYKSCLFRASHPQDQAKIAELTQRIAEHEKTKQELIAKIQNYENELVLIKKQITNLEVSADALTVFIQNQRANIEAEKKELMAKIRAYEEDTQLENEKALNANLLADLESLKDSIAVYEHRINNLEKSHERELQTVLKDASMLKFELANTRKSAEEKEREMLVSSLHDIAMAFDHAKNLEAKQLSHKAKLDKSQKNLSKFKDNLKTIAKTNLRLQNENDRLANQLNSTESSLDKHSEERQFFANKLLEKEEALSAAMLYYEETIADQAEQLKTLQDLLASENTKNEAYIKEIEASLLKNEKENENNLTLFQVAISEHLSEIETLQEKLQVEETLRQKLQQSHDELASKTSSTNQTLTLHEADKQSLKRALQEKDETLKITLSNSKESLSNYEEQIQNLQDRLDFEQSSKHNLKNENELLAAQADLHNDVVQALLLEKENEHAKALHFFQTTVSEHLSQVEALQEKLRAEEFARHQLQQAHGNLSFNHSYANETLAMFEIDKELLKQEIIKLNIEYNEKAAKEIELEHALRSLTVVAQHQDHVLAEASSAFSMIQEYNRDLESENTDLKSRLNRLETAEKSSKDSKSKEDNQASFIPKALMQLLKPKGQ